MHSAMFDVRQSQDVILSHGGWHEWQTEVRGDHEEGLAWAKSTKGTKKRSGLARNRDINGNDFSFRSAKTRLHSLAIELDELPVLEQAWEIHHPINIMMGCHSPKQIRIQYSAANTIALYNGSVE
jgi:hypothetical protein